MSISDKLIVAEFHARAFRRNAQDKGLAKEAAKSHGVDEDSADSYLKVYKHLFPDVVMDTLGIKNPMVVISTLRQNLRKFIEFRMFMQIGKCRFAVTQDVRPAILEERARIDALIEQQKAVITEKYGAMVTAARMILEGTWKEGDFPTVDQTLAASGYSLSWHPFPAANMFPSWVEDDVRESLSIQHNQEVSSAIVTGACDTIALIKEVADLWSNPNGRVFESTLERLKTKLEVLKANNSVASDATIGNIAQEALSMVESIDLTKLRNDVAFRSDTAAKLGGLATTGDGTMKVFYGRRALAVDTGE